LQRWLSLPDHNDLGATPIMSNSSVDFASLPTYQETRNSNAAWVQVTLTKTEPDGMRSQTIAIAPKAK